MNRPNLYMMIGIPGSGKSTYAKTHLQDANTIIVNSDKIREELYGDESVQKNPKKVFAILHSRVKKILLSGKNAVIDATNTSRRYRAETFEYLKGIDCKKIAVLVETPLEMCYKFDASRQRQVSKRVIDKFAREIEKPTLDEGFDEIVVFKNEYRI